MAKKTKSNGLNIYDLALQKSMLDSLTGAYDDALAEFFKDTEFKKEIDLIAARAFERLAYVIRQKLMEVKNDNNNGKRGKKSKRTH